LKEGSKLAIWSGLIGVKPGTETAVDLLLVEEANLKGEAGELETIDGAEATLFEGLVVLAGFRDVALFTADCALAFAACFKLCLGIEMKVPCLQKGLILDF
jgi:hypothetical protein